MSASALDQIVEQGSQMWKSLGKRARAELAALRASEQHWHTAANEELANAAEQRERAEQLRATVEQQARQLAEARSTIKFYAGKPYVDEYGNENGYEFEKELFIGERARAWLAANAPAEDDAYHTTYGDGGYWEIRRVSPPAPQAEQVSDDQHCPLCTWRGPVELDNGVCPQCDVNWAERYRNAPQAEQEQSE